MLQQPVGRVFGKAQDTKVEFQVRGRGGGPLYGLLPRRIGIEEDVDPVRVAAERTQVTLGGRRTERGHGVLDARLVEHEHVGVALYDERGPLPAHGLRNLREAVEQITLVEDLRFGGVEVLGLDVSQRPRTEANDPTPPVRYRERDPTGKPLSSPPRQ